MADVKISGNSKEALDEMVAGISQREQKFSKLVDISQEIMALYGSLLDRFEQEFGEDDAYPALLFVVTAAYTNRFTVDSGFKQDSEEVAAISFAGSKVSEFIESKLGLSGASGSVVAMTYAQSEAAHALFIAGAPDKENQH